MALTQVDAGLLNSTAQYTGFKNRIINGAMMIDQRNAGASVTPTSSSYTVDRWRLTITQASKFSAQQNAGTVTPPAGYTNYLGVTSLSAYSVVASDYFNLLQRIEGYNTADLGWGTANAQTVTLSFWVRSSLTGTFGGAINNESANRTYPFSYTISAANTWEQKSVTIAGDTSGTWAATNGVGVGVQFSLGAGSTYTSTAGTWQAGNYWGGVTGQTSVVGTSGATFYITGVQLEKGSTATSFDYRPYGTELALCQRYYETLSGYNSCYSNGINGMSCGVYFKVTKRASPTTAYASTYAIVNWTSPAIGASTIEYVEVTQSVASSAGFARIGFSLTISAEL